ncbi:MAG: patatin-like phospholipase family protein, partial [Acidobacteriota bacterium]
AQPFPSFFPSAGAAVCVLEVQGDIPIWLVGQDTEWLRRLVTNWRESGSAEQLLVLLLTENTAAQLRDSLISGDTVVAYADTGLNQEPNQSFMHYFGLAEYCSIWPKSDDRYGRQSRQGNWCFQIDAVELERVVNPALSWDRTTYPTIDWIARWITHREIGIVLGAGAARGFAHLGVLQVLEEEGIPIDYACGTSMGGAVATIYGKTGNAADTIQIIRSLIGSNNKIRDLSWCPKSSLMAGKKLERAIIRATGGSTFAELQKPAAVLASDLVRRERFVFERGSTAMALLATTAIPGIFPPVVFGNRILVDGALLSRVPMDLLDRRRCGLKMAVNVVPSSDLTANLDALHCQRIKHQLDKFFGFRHVITKAWEILAWWQGASEAEAADILIEPRTDPHAGYDFDAVNELIEAGREAARKKLGGIRRSLDSLLKPGVP